MKQLSVVIFIVASFTSSIAIAQGLSRAQVQQQLVEAQQNGTQHVTNSSYPDLGRVYQSQDPNPQTKAASAYGGVPSDTAVYGSHALFPGTASREACVGPVSFCDLYKGS